MIVCGCGSNGGGGGAALTVIESCTSSAAAHVASPAWDAVTEQVPSSSRVRIGPSTLQVEGVSAWNVTVRPEVALAAISISEPTMSDTGRSNAMVCGVAPAATISGAGSWRAPTSERPSSGRRSPSRARPPARREPAFPSSPPCARWVTPPRVTMLRWKSQRVQSLFVGSGAGTPSWEPPGAVGPSAVHRPRGGRGFRACCGGRLDRRRPGRRDRAAAAGDEPEADER